MADEPIPIGEALPGFTIRPLGKGWTPLEAYVLIKALDEDGDHSWSLRTTHRFNDEELLGALTVQVDLIRARLVRQWQPPPPPDQ